MRVYIDGTPLWRPRDGVGRYTLELLKQLLDVDKTNNYVVVGFSGDKRRPKTLSHRRLSYEFLPLPRKLYSLSYKVWPLPVNRWLKHQPDSVLYPNFVAFPLINAPISSVIIHDLVNIEMPNVVETKNRRFLNRFIPYSLKRPGTNVVATTNFVADSLVRHFDLTRQQIGTVPPAIDPKFGQVKPARVTTVRRKYKLPLNYMLFVGSLQPRKNIGGVLAAYSRLPDRLKVNYPLVIAGAPGWKDDRLKQQLKMLQKSGTPIITTGHFEDSELPALYAGASLFVFPSFYEGFGLPILEAMSAGVPVITANTSATPDTAGGAAKLVDPYNPLAIEAAMRDLLTYPEQRQELITKGRANLKRWSWRSSARRLLKIINSTPNSAS